jgi:hypothetical protein
LDCSRSRPVTSVEVISIYLEVPAESSESSITVNAAKLKITPLILCAIRR